ncbi:tRNA(Ile)-lysidine synthase [Fontibacillus solani]|uniref:tRNA(Ile)-lysidine synthase n=1 Tax=Fontibacillus solani TaxID=1572857 RepID=A0A7W3SWK2_9BACL|nr:tRNA lysidine(34) synthetase TilS [Fontibacillus solani]MBA9087549.1 tRNA(Ile)-lysidine synthase [Fontibacillus solani]
MMERKMYRLVEEARLMDSEYHLWSPGDCIVVAVSGGPDSVALLHILNEISKDKELGLRLVCAHVNHGLRGEQSDEEAEFVRNLAGKLGIPFELGFFDIPSYMKDSGKGLQLAARDKRYEFLHDVATRYSAASIALAHHANDQAETVMMRILRGSGPSGLAGMRVKRRDKKVELIRPLLRIYKDELILACDTLGIPYVIDSSNLLPKYARNAVRLDVLPFLGQYNEQLTDSLNRLAEVIGVEDDYIQREAEAAYAKLVFKQDGLEAFRINSFINLHAALQRRMIKLILNYLPLSTDEGDFVKIEAIRKGAIQNSPTTWSIDLGGGLRCLREYDTIRFALAESQIPHYTYVVEHFPAEVFIKDTGRTLRFTREEADLGLLKSEGRGNDEAVFDTDGLHYPLTVRSRLPGDIMKVMGLNGSKKVKDIFIDEKIPPSLRSEIPIVTDANGQILWIPGVRRSAIATVSPHTSSVVVMALQKGRE